jgi:hypothetical protein
VASTKRVRFDYFRVYLQELDQERTVVRQNIFDLQPILAEAQSISVPDRTYRFRGEESRLQSVVNNSSIWALHFIRIRKDDIPSIANDDGTLAPLDLDDDEGIGEEVSAAYDESRQVIMIQRNRDSLSPTGIQEYFNEVWQEEDKTIVFKPIISPDAFGRIAEDDLVRSVSIRFADINSEVFPITGGLKRIVDIGDEHGAVNMEITLSLGRKDRKNGTLQGVYSLIQSLREKKNVTRLEVRKKDTPDSAVDVLDLIEDRLVDHTYFDVSRGDPLGHGKVFAQMNRLYSKQTEYLNEILG